MPSNDNKPTPEELQSKIDEALAIPDEELEVPQVDTEEEPQVEEEPEQVVEEVEEEVAPSKEEKQVLKEKLSASARENQKIYAKNRVINQALEEADEIPEPTEEELEKEYKDWDSATEFEKISLKEALISKRWRAKISEAKEQATKIEKWNDSVESFIDDPKNLIEYPDLEGKTEAFKEYATQESSNSVPFNILVSAFLHQHASSNKPHKGKMFETGSGGPNETPRLNNGMLTIEQGAKLKQQDYAKYREYLKAGKIASDI